MRGGQPVACGGESDQSRGALARGQADRTLKLCGSDARPACLLGALAVVATSVGWAAGPGDPVARLQQRIDSGEVKLEYRPHQGYLASLLEAFDIPLSSQTFVFSKTSAQFRLISPRSPRALYFNDDVYVGYVPGGPILGDLGGHRRWPGGVLLHESDSAGEAAIHARQRPVLAVPRFGALGRRARPHAALGLSRPVGPADLSRGHDRRAPLDALRRALRGLVCHGQVGCDDTPRQSAGRGSRPA